MKKRLEMGQVKSDLDENQLELDDNFQILMWYQPYGLKSENKGVNKEKVMKIKHILDIDEHDTSLEELFSGFSMYQ